MEGERVSLLRPTLMEEVEVRVSRASAAGASTRRDSTTTMTMEQQQQQMVMMMMMSVLPEVQKLRQSLMQDEWRWRMHPYPRVKRPLLPHMLLMHVKHCFCSTRSVSYSYS